MSCQINSIGNIAKIDEIRKLLFFPDAENDLGTESWLQKCLISVSPVGDLIAMGKGRKLVILTSKWDSVTSSTILQKTYSGTVHEVDSIKSILCLPIVGQSKSSNILHDWTCVLIGFESGYVRAYLETCQLVYEDQFHNEEITSIKCRSQHSPRSDIASYLHPEEIYIQYQSNVCIIQGKQFFQVLRNNRAQLARVQANSELLDCHQQPLDVRKWEFQDQSVIKDIAVVGLSISNTFDNLLAASTCGGYDSKFRSVPPNHTLVLAVGSKPFLGFHFGTEGSNQAILSDVAKIVAHKLKSALPSWLTGNTQAEKRPAAVQQPTDPMGCRFGLCDLNRTANVIILSSDHKLAAISDSLGRVIIIDTEKGIALKILKGYREAQCAFVQVPDNRHSISAKIERKVALFLVVYSPKKGTIEIFNTQQFMKIATFSASKHSRLIYINYSLMGFSQTTKSKYACQFTTLLIDSDGQMKEILIPFHFALNEKSSKKARDIHLYKKLRQMIRCEDYNTDALTTATLQTVKEIQTIEMKFQLLELLLKTKHLPVEVLLQCAIYIVDNMDEEVNKESELKIKANNIVRLLNFYIFMKSKSDESDPDSKYPEDTGPILKLGEREMNQMKDFLAAVITDEENHSKDLRVTFAEKDTSSISEFLSTFNLTKIHDTEISLLPKYDETIIQKCCEHLFSNFNEKCKNFEQFKLEVEKSNINTKDLFLLVIMYWVNRPLNSFLNLEDEINNLTNILYILIKRAIDISPIKNSSLKYYWQDMREIIFNANKPFPALTAAVSCKYVAFKIEKEQELDDTSIAIEDEELEIWSKENIEWTLLIGKLEDVSLLNILIMKEPFVSKYCTLPKLKSDKKLDISLNFVLQRKGSVSELVARWLAQSGIDPELIVWNGTLNEQPKASETFKIEEEKICPKEMRDFLETEQLFKKFNMIKFHWPYSLDTGMILANVCWEYAMQWQAKMHTLENLQASISCLKAIPNFFLKLGLFNLLWKIHLRVAFENSIKLINTVGKVPKKRLCVQDVNLSDIEIPIFLKIITDYLDTFTDVAQDMYVEPKTPLKFETLWENGGQPLAELAVQQTNINYELLLVHYELSLVFHMLCEFSIKAFKPMANLFDVEVNKVFFLDFQEKPEVDYGRTDSALSTARMQFLKKIISSAAETITSKDGKDYFKDFNYWVSKCLLLGTIWKLNCDIIRTEEVKLLYIHGYDAAACSKKGAIEDRCWLGMELLLIAGKRMEKYMAKSSDLGTIYTYLTPMITGWIEKLNKDWCAESSLKDIQMLTREAKMTIGESRNEYRLAREFCEALDQLIKQLETNDSDTSVLESSR